MHTNIMYMDVYEKFIKVKVCNPHVVILLYIFLKLLLQKIFVCVLKNPSKHHCIFGN